MKFTSEDLRRIAARASTINERIHGSYRALNSPQSSDTARFRIDRWRDIACGGDQELFNERLGMDGLTLESAARLLGDIDLNEGEMLPSWLMTFEDLFEALLLPTMVDTKELNKPEIAIPFEPLLGGAVAIAKSFITSSELPTAMITEKALVSMTDDLLKRLSNLLGPALFDSFCVFRATCHDAIRNSVGLHGSDSSDAKFRLFVSHMQEQGWREFFLIRPVLARLMSLIFEQWKREISEVIKRLSHDYSVLSRLEAFGGGHQTIQYFEFGKSDPHNEGRSVCIIHLSNGQRIVYKPRNLAIDLAWTEVISWIRKHNGPESAYAPVVIDRNDYGWMEFVENRPCADSSSISEYYTRCGALLCLVQMLQGTDMHHENIIAKGEFPSIVDLEALLHPWLVDESGWGGASPALESAKRKIRESVLATGLLPGWIRIHGGQLIGVGGLRSRNPTPIVSARFCSSNTDEMSFGKRLTGNPRVESLPLLSGEHVDPGHYTNLIEAGYKSMYVFIMERTVEISRFLEGTKLKESIVRFIAKPTQLYASILKRSLERENLCDGSMWSMQFEFLAQAVVWHEPSSASKSIFRLEVRALTQLDIPLFHARADGRDILAYGDSRIQSCFEGSGYIQALKRIAAASTVDLEQQIAMIRHSFSENAVLETTAAERRWSITGAVGSCRLHSATEILAIAERFGKLIEGSLVCSHDDGALIGVVPLPGEERGNLGVLGPDLYAGNSGVAIFYAALGHLTGNKRWFDISSKLVRPLECELAKAISNTRLARRLGIGGAVGMGSVVYALAKIAVLTGDPRHLISANDAADSISDRLIERDRLFDVMAGSAGTILGLLYLFNIERRVEILNKAIRCGDHLLRHLRNSAGNSASWTSGTSGPLTGFSHGTAGISLALGRLYAVSCEVRFLNAARAAIQFERGTFSEADKQWRDLRFSSVNSSCAKFSCMWCHGASGIGLARIGMLDVMCGIDSVIESEIEYALNATRIVPMRGYDHLCCGNFGRIELMIAAGMKFGRDGLIDEAIDRASDILGAEKSGRRLGFRQGSEAVNPGFFTGVSGIGYTLLRLAYPKRLSSVLLWE